ncbi:hypothetical protein EXIGLDRAFT_781565, partial [Exidia glandulosa HHB12029]
MLPIRHALSQPLLVLTAPLDYDDSQFALFNMTNNSETRTRRRIQPAQLECLEALYAKSTHPSRDARSQAAAQTGMDLKTVTIWLQNKRQAVKKAATVAPSSCSSSASSSLPNTTATRPPLRRTVSVPNTRLVSSWRRTKSLPPLLPLPRVSLDAFAERANARLQRAEHVTPPA